MAIIRQSLDDIRAAKRGRPPLHQATDADIARAILNDADTVPEVTLDQIIAPKNIRRRLNMTQEQFAEAVGLPVATLRNWEQGRNSIDPAGKSLLILLARDPEAALATLAAARAA
jgi:putative transcriptional regulator